jgi:uncharacterized protein
VSYRILSIDGGGIRGAYAAALLERLCAAAPDLLSGVNLYAGTSTGSLLALGLAYGLKPAELVELYRREGRRIFDDSWVDNIRDLGGLAGADYDWRNLVKVLEGLYQDTTLADLPARVLVPAFDLDAERDGVRAWKAKFFHNFPGPSSDGAERVVDVAARSCAAPTFFPSYQGFIDGGVVANNPSMAALAKAWKEGHVINVSMLSIGTGRAPQFLEGEVLDWGILRWAKPLVSLMLEGGAGVAAYQCQQILDGRFHRLDPVLPRAFRLDDADATDDLVELAQGVDITETIDWLRENWSNP